jgi:RNA polymerase sigma-70 factor, ECF subfamily
MGTVKSAQRREFEEAALPHLDALWKTSLWLTMRSSHAERLVMDTMKQAYRTWHNPNGAVGGKARLFRILTREFYDASIRRHPSAQYLTEHNITGADGVDSQFPVLSVVRENLMPLAEIPGLRVKGAIARLRPLSRLILILKVREGFSYSDIAYITDLRTTSVRTIIARLRRLLPGYLVQHADSPDNTMSYEDAKSNLQRS